MQLIEHHDSPRYIRLHLDDNVAIVVNEQGVSAGGQFPDGLVTLEAVPQSHKVSLVDIPEGGAVVRYGTVIGYALKPIPRGVWVTEQLINIPDAPALDDLPMATLKAPTPEPLEGYTFEGFRNPDGGDHHRSVRDRCAGSLRGARAQGAVAEVSERR